MLTHTEMVNIIFPNFTEKRQNMNSEKLKLSGNELNVTAYFPEEDTLTVAKTRGT